MMLTRCSVSVVVCILCVIALFAGAAASEAKKLEGQWTLIAASRNGKTDKVGLKKIVATISGNKMTVTEEGVQEKREVAIMLDASKSPKWIDLIKANRPDEGRTRGIYKLIDDEFTICFPEGRDAQVDERPSKFAAPEGSNLTLVTFKKK